ncbi:hypothetical protein UY3_07325 [Chelonia mydas]|uniref:Uncharacterized protein n=1 Tax=Chelonia mydas TaxID=8469 RepID=M7BTG1_CHEMY|nr:hypothetical protein UY3_07325 [Chelonia mydas]
MQEVAERYSGESDSIPASDPEFLGDARQNRLVEAIAPRLGKVAVNCAIPSTDSQLRPDVVVTDEAQKKIILVDVTVSFENRTPAFREARARKLEKYAPPADTLRAKGYEVQMDALIVGALALGTPATSVCCGPAGWVDATHSSCGASWSRTPSDGPGTSTSNTSPATDSIRRIRRNYSPANPTMEPGILRKSCQTQQVYSNQLPAEDCAQKSPRKMKTPVLRWEITVAHRFRALQKTLTNGTICGSRNLCFIFGSVSPKVIIPPVMTAVLSTPLYLVLNPQQIPHL